jgi:DNA replicative helicase MCM subunit Mcm2 (Cdc46/Mcm family)
VVVDVVVLVDGVIGYSHVFAFVSTTIISFPIHSSIHSSIHPSIHAFLATFTEFVLSHTIRRVIHNNNDNSNDNHHHDDRLFEPTALDMNNPHHRTPMIERVPCYPPLLQRIVDKDYDDTSMTSTTNTNTNNNNNNGNDHSLLMTMTTFLVEIPLTELIEWDGIRGKDLAERAIINTVRYQSIFAAVLDDLLRTHFHRSNSNNNNSNNNNSGQSSTTNRTGTVLLRQAMDILQEQRLAIHRQALQEQQQQQQNNNHNDHDNNNDPDTGVMGDAAHNNTNNNNNPTNTTAAGRHDFPPLLMRRYELRILPIGRRGSFFPFQDQYTIPNTTTTISPPVGVSLRHVRSRNMGRLVTITGMVVKSSEVKPMLQVAAYTCDVCGSEIYRDTHNQRDFMPERICPICALGMDHQNNNNNNNNHNFRRTTTRRNMGILQLETRGSKFIKFQELKLQELPNQVPMGHVPRSLSVICRGELTRLANPGDVTTIDGIFLPQRIHDASGGAKRRRAGLMTTLFLEAQNIIVHKKSYDDTTTTTTNPSSSSSPQLSSSSSSSEEEELTNLEMDLQRVATSSDPIGVLSQSIAPEIFGHADIKRALLLQLTGGVSRNMPDGMRIRGDINICLMGDPGVAKSQLLKHVATIAPRGVYTTGKGSSGVGLTAAITKDTMTGELSLEGGALVLADRGICAIDEFDKMDESDRTAIHEVMEQQTVSIAKAGIVSIILLLFFLRGGRKRGQTNVQTLG